MSVEAILEWLNRHLRFTLNWVERHLGWTIFFLAAALTILVAVIVYLKQRR